MRRGRESGWFQYLGVQSNRERERELKKRVHEGGIVGRMSGVICERRVSARVKGKVTS